MLQSLQLFVTLWTVALEVPLSMGFSRQAYWNGLPCPPPEDLPDPGIEPASLISHALAGGFFMTVREPHLYISKLLQRLERIPEFPGGASGKEPACQCRRCKRCRLDLWVRKIPQRRTRQTSPVFLPVKCHGQRSLGSQRVGHD